ncbi:MAG: hypothetical protein DDT22_01098 [candidate division WS2 bacterium]|nr:hypothetical protein [Candidatus Lithacetigena glycinireducens]
MKIIIKKGKLITRKELFYGKEKFHKKQAKLPIKEKIEILVKLQRIACSIKGDSDKRIIWKIEE